MVIFTSICANYVHKARTLAQSVKRHVSNAKFIVCLLEREIDPRIPADYFDDVVLAKDMWKGNFDRFIFKHTIVEASTSVKGSFFQYLFSAYPEETQFVYLDPDCFVYDELVELRNLLETRPIALCPHLLHPGNIDMELSSTAHGVYNLGFLGVNRSEEATRFIDWWAERLYLFCYDDMLNGIFTDQKWVDLAPCFFDTHILKHAGYDLAPWSLLGTQIHKEQDQYFIQGDPLRFIHFSGFGSVAEKCMADWMGEHNLLFRELYDHYAVLHTQNNADAISSSRWSYSTYHDGSPISDNVRKHYRANYDVMFAQDDPFEKSDTYFLDQFLGSPASTEPPATLPKGKIRFLYLFVEICRTEGLRAALHRSFYKVRRKCHSLLAK